MKIFLHGFATTPEIWPEGGPALRFDDLEREALRISKGIGKGSGAGQGATLVGWSMGGMLAMMIAARFPEKVDKLILVSTTPKFVASPDFPHGLPLALLRSLRKRIRKEGTKAFHSLVFKDGKKVGLADLTVEQAERELAELEKADLRPLLDKIRIPTLIIHGDKDEICLPSAAVYMKERIGNSELVMLEGAGHASIDLIRKYAG